MSTEKTDVNQLTLAIQPDGLHQFPYLAAARFHLHFLLGIKAAANLAASDVIVFSFRDLFALPTSSAAPSCRRELGVKVAAGASEELMFTVSNDELPLTPSLYQARADIVRDGRSLLGGRNGTALFYLLKSGESAYHAIGSRLCGQAGLVSEQLTSGVALYQLGGALLGAAGMFRDMGETERAEYCESVALEYLERVVFAEMIDEQGLFHELRPADGGRSRAAGAAHNSCQAAIIALVAEAARRIAGREANGAELIKAMIEKTKAAFRYLMREPPAAGVGCGYEATGCRLYDGLVLLACAEWLDLCRAAGVETQPEHTAWLLAFAIQSAKSAAAADGWCDPNCMADGGSHIASASAYMAAGLRAARRLAEALPVLRGLPLFFKKAADVSAQLEFAEHRILNFLVSGRPEREIAERVFANGPAAWLTHALLSGSALGTKSEPLVLRRLREIERSVSADDVTQPDADPAQLSGMSVMLRACPEFLAVCKAAR